MKMKQEISELLDGELNAANSAQTIALISADKTCENQWQKLCTARAVMRGDYVSPVDSSANLADKVSLSLELEPAIVAPSNLLHLTGDTQSNLSNVTDFPQQNSNAVKLGVVALAASFFAVAFLNLNPFSAIKKQSLNSLASQNTKAEKLPAFLAAEQELQALVVAHGEFASMAGLNGLATYAKIINADGAQ